MILFGCNKEDTEQLGYIKGSRKGLSVMSIFVRIKREDCQSIISSQLDSGLLEIVIPKNCAESEINKHLNSIRSEFAAIGVKQKEETEIFRKKVKKLIDQYAKEFELHFLIKLRLQKKTKKLNDCNVEVHGVVFQGNVSLMAILQFVDDTILERIVRYTVYDMACQYEQLWSEIKERRSTVLLFPDNEVIEETRYDIPEAAKYHIAVPYSEIQKIQSDYYDAVKQFAEMQFLLLKNSQV